MLVLNKLNISNLEIIKTVAWVLIYIAAFSIGLFTVNQLVSISAVGVENSNIEDIRILCVNAITTLVLVIVIIGGYVAGLIRRMRYNDK